MVTRWRNRFIESGSKGLVDLHRKGRPSVYTRKIPRRRIKNLGMRSSNWVWTMDRILACSKIAGLKTRCMAFSSREQRISLARKAQLVYKYRPGVYIKAADVVGLYLAPPENAFVICVDEKPNIQALERRTGYAVTSDNKLVHGFEDRYKRNGTLNLFAALEVASGIIHTKSTESSQKTKGIQGNFFWKSWLTCLKPQNFILLSTITLFIKT